MSRRSSVLRLGTPLAILAVITVLILNRCGSQSDESAGITSVRDTQTGGPTRTASDPDTWAAAFSRQLPPPPELEPDAAEMHGTFDNGMRYVVLEQPESAGRMSLRLMVLAGSMHEAEDERGLAHFVEHMAFRKTRSLDNGEALAAFERLGLKAGADSNAFTSRDCTVYQLDIPDAAEGALDTALTFLHDVADGIEFLQTEVDAERKIILREMDERRNRTAANTLAAAIFPAVPAAAKAPIGLEPAVASATPEILRRYWRRQYVTPRMILIAAGDFDARPMITTLARRMGTIPRREPPPDPSVGHPMAGETGATLQAIATPPEMATAQPQIRVTLAAPRPADTAPDSVEKRRTELIRRVGIKLLENRTNRRATTSDRAIGSISSGVPSLIPGISRLELSATGGADVWRETLTHVATVWREAVQRGFTDLEFSEACHELKSEIHNRFFNRLTREAPAAADELVEAMRNHRWSESPEVEVNRSRTTLATLTRVECEDQLRHEWGPLIRIVLTGDVSANIEAEASTILETAWQQALADPPNASVPALELPPQGRPGRILRRTVDPERGYVEAEFANHVIVRLRPVPGLGGLTRLLVQTGYGMLSVPPEHPGLTLAAELLSYQYPLSGWTQAKLDAALYATDCSMEFKVRQSHFEWEATTSRAGMAQQIQLLCAATARPGIADLPDSWRPARHNRAWADYTTAGRPVLWSAIHGFDRRFCPDAGDLDEITGNLFTSWLLPILRNGRLRVMISGDFAPDDALRLLSSTFGALPTREPWDADTPFPPVPPPPRGIHRKTASDSLSQARAAILLPLPKAASVREGLRLRLLTDLLNLRIRQEIRERLGASYSPRVVDRQVDGMPHSLVIADAPCAAEKSDEIGEALRETVLDFARRGWTPDEFRRASRPTRASLRKSARNPDWWLRWLDAPALCPVPDKIEMTDLTAAESSLKAFLREHPDPEQICELRFEP